MLGRQWELGGGGEGGQQKFQHPSKVKKIKVTSLGAYNRVI
jgi:hypothetical protein